MTEKEYIKLNDIKIYQPDEGLEYNFTTTYTENSKRTQRGAGHFTPLFTVEQFGYKATDVPSEEASKILKIIAKGKPFTLHCFSAYYNAWRDAKFYVGKGNLSIKRVSPKDGKIGELSFNMTGVNPI